LVSIICRKFLNKQGLISEKDIIDCYKTELNRFSSDRWNSNEFIKVMKRDIKIKEILLTE